MRLQVLMPGRCGVGPSNCYLEVHPGLHSALRCLLWPDPSCHLEPTSQVVVGIAGDVVGRVQAHPRAASVRAWGGAGTGRGHWLSMSRHLQGS